MKGKLIPGVVVGRLSDVVLDAGAVGGQVGRAGNAFGCRVLFIREEGKSASGWFGVISDASNDRADFCLEVDVWRSVGGFRFILGKFGVETVILFD